MLTVSILASSLLLVACGADDVDDDAPVDESIQEIADYEGDSGEHVEDFDVDFDATSGFEDLDESIVSELEDESSNGVDPVDVNDSGE